MSISAILFLPISLSFDSKIFYAFYTLSNLLFYLLVIIYFLFNFTGPSPTNVAVGKMPVSHSTDSLQAKFTGGGSVRITDQVIEEVDEQQTITSMGRPQEPRPNVMTIFPTTSDQPFQPSPVPGHPPQSAPLPVPPGRPTMTHISSSAPNTAAIPPTVPASPTKSSVTYTEVLSVKSAPGFDNSSGLGSGSVGPNEHYMDNLSLASSSDTSEDEFSKLKQSRRQERINYARSVSAQQGAMGEGGSPPENESLLMELSSNSRTGLLQSSPKLNRDSFCS